MQENFIRSLGQEDPERREWLPTPVFLPGESHGQRSLVGYSPLAYKKSDMTECLNTFSHIHTTCIFNKYSFSTCFHRTWPLFSKTLLIFSYKLGFFFLVSYFINITGSNLPKFNKPVFFFLTVWFWTVRQAVALSLESCSKGTYLNFNYFDFRDGFPNLHLLTKTALDLSSKRTSKYSNNY